MGAAFSVTETFPAKATWSTATLWPGAIAKKSTVPPGITIDDVVAVGLAPISKNASAVAAILTTVVLDPTAALCCVDPEVVMTWFVPGTNARCLKADDMCFFPSFAYVWLAGD